MADYKVTASIPLPKDPIDAAKILVSFETAIGQLKALMPEGPIVSHGIANSRGPRKKAEQAAG